MFSSYRSTFDPDQLLVLQDAFERAWALAMTVPSIRADQQAARDLIAKRIVEAALGQEEQTPEQLKRHALQAFDIQSV